MSNQERKNVLEKMNKVIKNSNDDYFPTIVDLTRSNCIKLPLNNYNNKDYPPNIRMDYAVTDKADGLRKLLFITNNGKCYLKSRDRKNDDKYSLKYTGTVINAYADSIFDGELIESTMDGKYVQNFYIFDAYAVKGESFTDKSFGEIKDKSGRYYQVVEFEKYVKTEYDKVLEIAISDEVKLTDGEVTTDEDSTPIIKDGKQKKIKANKKELTGKVEERKAKKTNSTRGGAKPENRAEDSELKIDLAKVNVIPSGLTRGERAKFLRENDNTLTQSEYDRIFKKQNDLQLAKGN